MRRVLLLLVLLLAVPAHAADVDLDALLADLAGPNGTKRSSAYTALRNAKDPRAVPRLLALAPDLDLVGRSYTVYILEGYPPKAARQAFGRLAKEDDPYLRLAAGTYLLRQGDGRHVPLIVAALRQADVDASTRLYMVNRLYGVTEPRVREAMRGLVVPGAAATMLGAVFQALQTPEEEASKERARALLAQDDRADAQALAAAFLYRWGEEGRKAELAAALRGGALSTTAFVRVRSFLTTTGHVAAEILDAATEALDAATNVILQRYLAEFLGTHKHRKALPRLQKLMDHENDMVAKAAFEAVMEMGGGLDDADLLRMLAEGAPGRRLAAADLMRRKDDPRGMEAVIEILASDAPVLTRSDAARMLGLFRVRAAVDPLLDALMDPQVSVRQAALYAVDQLLRALFPYRRLDFVATGYAAADGEAKRRAAVAKIEAWWEIHREGGW